jgi:hypothetical protein
MWGFFFVQNIGRKLMLIIQNRSQLHHIIDPDIHKLVTFRLAQLGSILTAPMIIIELGDSLSSIEKEIGFPILTNLFDDITYPDPDFVPSCEALADHGGFYEMLFILGDGEEAIEIFIPKTGVDSLLLAMCADFAVKVHST